LEACSAAAPAAAAAEREALAAAPKGPGLYCSAAILAVEGRAAALSSCSSHRSTSCTDSCLAAETAAEADGPFGQLRRQAPASEQLHCQGSREEPLEATLPAAEKEGELLLQFRAKERLAEKVVTARLPLLFRVQARRMDSGEEAEAM
jgi:hypothetical protein